MYYNPSDYQAVQGVSALCRLSNPAAGLSNTGGHDATTGWNCSTTANFFQEEETIKSKARGRGAVVTISRRLNISNNNQAPISRVLISPRIPMLSNRLISNSSNRLMGNRRSSRVTRNNPANTRDNMQVISSKPPAMQSPPTAEPQSGLNQDPVVRDAQQKAYERAVARQRAAELASQQQAAVQEFQQAQQMLETAQNKFRDQETRQKQLQEEYHKKAVAEAYETLRAAQQRYYDLMGVSGESGRPGRLPPGISGPGQRPPTDAIPQQAPVQGQPQPYRQQPPAAQYPPQRVAQQPQYQYGAGQAPVGMPAGQTFSPSPPGQATPLTVQQQPQQEEGGGFWSTLKEIFLPPTTSVRIRDPWTPRRERKRSEDRSSQKQIHSQKIRLPKGSRIFFSNGLTADTLWRCLISLLSTIRLLDHVIKESFRVLYCLFRNRKFMAPGAFHYQFQPMMIVLKDLAAHN